MKRHGIHSANCSCTSCVYRSRSKQPSVQQLIEEGSRIDKLYYGKYLPLRERKLLEKLIRTRAVYDDVRNQLLSTSGSSDQTRSEHKIKRRDDDSTEKSSAVLKMVDLVDRGQIGSPHTSKLSSCCSCCSCSSLRKIKKHMEKHPSRVHRHHVPYEDIARYTAAAEERGKRRRRKLSTKISSKIRTVHFKMKKIRSEPCACTLSLSSVIKRPSKAFIQKIRSRENEIGNVQAQKVVTVERKPLKNKIFCSCKAKLPMKSIQKIKNIRKSTTKTSGTDMGNQKAFRIKKDSLTIFREKLSKKRAYKDWECEPGTCVVDECIPEQCLKKIKAKGVGEKRRVKYQNRISGSGLDNRVSISTRAKQIKRIDSKAQATPGSTMGHICECKPTSRSASSMTSFLKQKSLVKIKPPTKEKSNKTDRYTPKRTESYESYDTKRIPVQGMPKHKLIPVICDCKPAIKSTHSMTTVRTETRKKRPAMSKHRPQYEEKGYKTGRYEKEKVQVSPGPNLGHAICECKPYTKSISSMTTIPKAKLSKTMKPKPPPQQLGKRTVIQEKKYESNRDKIKQAELYSAERKQALPASKLGSVICDCKPATKSADSMTSSLKTLGTQSVSKLEVKVKKPTTPKQRPHKEKIRNEKAYKTGRQKEMVHVSPKYNLGYVTCECKPSTKSIFSLSSIKKAKARKPKSGLQLVIKEEKLYKTDRRKSNQIKQIKSHEIQVVQASPKSKLGNVICECKPTTKSTSSMTSVPRSKTKTRAKIPKRYKVHRPGIHKTRKESYQYHKMEQEPPEKQAVKISSSFKFEIEFSKKKYPAMTNKEIVEHVREKRAKRIKPTHSKRKQYKKYQNSKIQVTGAKSNHESQISYVKQSASQTAKPYHDIALPFPRECEPSMCIPYECDPKSCARILLSRSKSRGRSVMASTGRLRRKSAGSTTLSRTTNSKSRYVQSKSIESFETYPREAIKEPLPHKPGKDNNFESSQKQAVRITSSFNFNIEFYKESPETKTNDGVEVAYEPQREIPQKEMKQTIKRKKYKERGHGARSINSRNFSSQSRSSQSFKNIQVGHRLKRCFCTLKLLQKKKQIKGIEKRAHIDETQTNSSGIAYVTPPVTSHPCECSDKIKERKDSNTTGNSRKSLSINIEPGEYKSRQQKDKRFRHKGIENSSVYGKPNKNEKKRMQQKGIKVHKPHVRNAASLTTKNVKAKHTYTTPFIQKCLCTLKLLKKNKEKAGSLTSFSRRSDYIAHKQKKSITNNRENTKNKHVSSKQCECEPIPVECDPYICEKIAKHHVKLHHKHSTTGDHATRSTFSGTSRSLSSSKSRNTQSYIRGSGDKAIKSPDKIITTPSNSKRQAVRVGSNFSFNIEFYKENHSANTGNAPEILPRKEPHDKHVKKYKHKVNKLKTTGSQQFKHRSHHKAITAEPKHKEKGVFVGSAIKRCFCTLKLHKTGGKNTKLQEKKDVTSKSTKTSYPLPNPQTCECKSTSTKLGKPVYDLKRYECPPGMCNAYECYEELKRREIKRLHNQHINTNRNKRKSTMSMTTSMFSVSSKTKSTQSKLLKQTLKKDHRLRALQEDSRTTHSILPSRQAVQLGSNFSFNVEFFKERSLSSAQKTAYKIRPEDFNSVSSRTIKKTKGTKDRRLVVKNRLSQAIIQKEDKAANVGFILKRCFCTLGLQKKKKPQHEFGHYPPITVQIVQMDRNPKNTCNSVFPNINKTEGHRIANDHNMIKPRYGTPNKTIYKKESINLTNPESIYPFKKSFFDLNQNMYHLPQYLGNFKSRIDFNVGEYQVGNLVIDAQEANPFYQSFYALNVKVSKLKNIPGDTYALGDHECAPGVCVPYECDPAKCLKMINERMKLSKPSGSDRTKNKTIGTTKKIKSKSGTAKAHSNIKKQKLNKDCQNSHPSRVSISMRLSKNTKPRKEGLKFTSPYKPELTKDIAPRQSLCLGTDFNFGMGFSKDRNNDNNMSNDHEDLQHTDANHESQHKAKSLLAKCLCPIKKLTETHFKSNKSSQQDHSYHKKLCLGTDLNLAMGFYKDTSSGDDMITNAPKLDVGKHGEESLRNRKKAKQLLAKCLCPIKRLTETHFTNFRPSQNSCLNCSRSQGSSLPSRKVLRVGSDFSIAMGFYKDKNPRRNGVMVSMSPNSELKKDAETLRQAVRVGSNLSFGVRFSKGIPAAGDNIKINTLDVSKHDKNFKCERRNYSQKNNEYQNKAVPSNKSLLTKCLCPVEKNSEMSTLYKKQPRQTKNIHSSRKGKRLKSDLNIATTCCNSCKDTKYHNDHIMLKNASSQSRSRHRSQIKDKSKKTSSGISKLITKCFCTAKLKTKTKQATKTEKAGKSKNFIESGKETSKKKVKPQNDKRTMVKNLKHPSTSSFTKKCKSTKTKTVESSKPTNQSTYSKYSASQNQNRTFERQAASFGSSISFSVGFVKDSSSNGSLSSVYQQCKPGTQINKGARVSPVYPSNKSLLTKCLCPIEKISEMSTLYKKQPRQTKNIHSSRKGKRLKSDLNIATTCCNSCKDTKHHNDHIMLKNASSQSRSRHRSQIKDKSKKTSSGISKLITKCFCTAKLKTKTKQATKTEKAGKSKHIIECGKKTFKKKVKTQNDKSTMVNNLKHPSTSSFTKKCKSKKTKESSKPTNQSTYSQYSFSVGFVKDSSSNGSLSSVYQQCKPGTQINKGARVSPVYFSKIEETGYNRPITDSPEQHCVTKGTKYKKDPHNFRRKHSTKEIKSILKSNECEPNTCMPNKCVSIECEKNKKKRSKSTKVTREKKAASIKSAVIDRGTATKGKRLSKSYDLCHPKCEISWKALESINPEIGKTTKTKGKKKQQKEEKSCCCTLPSEQSNNKQKRTGSKKQTDLNKFIQKCFCSLKRIKGGKELSPKPSTERIPDGHKKGKQKQKIGCDNKTCKMRNDSEMKTIFAYSKRKFKKHESQTKVREVATNTKGLSFCPCTEVHSNQNTTSKIVKKCKMTANKGHVLQNDYTMAICSLCQNPMDAKSGKNKKSLPSCCCTNLEPQSLKAESKKKKGGRKSIRSSSIEAIGGQTAVCPECQRNVGAKVNKKRDKKDGVHLNLVPEKVGDQLDVTKKKGEKNHLFSRSCQNEQYLCPVCSSKLNEPQKKEAKKQDKKKSIPKKTVLQSNVCPCCHVKCKFEKKISKDSKPEKKLRTCIDDENNMIASTVEEEPLFEMYVNQDMNILNRDEVLANIISSGMESEEMIARTEGKGDSPVIEMVIDKHSASIVNCREILKGLIEKEMENKSIVNQNANNIAKKPEKSAIRPEKPAKKPEKSAKRPETPGKKSEKSAKKAETPGKKQETPAKKKSAGKQKAKSVGGATETQKTNAAAKKKTVGEQKAKSTEAADKQKPKEKGTPKQSKAVRITFSSPHDIKCKCCACRKVKPPKQKPQEEEEVEEEEEEEEEPPKPLSNPIFRKLKPCICGSVICKKDWEKIYNEQRSIKSLKKVKPCVCGTDICREESQKIPELLLKAARIEQQAKLKAKKAIEAEKRYQKERLKRKKLYAKEDKALYKRRRKQDKIDMKKLKKYETAPDLLMVTESLVDVGKFGAKAFCDLMTTVCRYFKHPRDAVHNVKDYARDPSTATKTVKESCKGMGFFSTLARIKRRALNMRFTKKAIVKLESYPVTNYIVHMADKDPRKRMKKFKQKRTREPMDFECSLFMASLRKRPCLGVYYTCPWFYPHCVSLLGLWKQFTDVLLFILAVGVWSPCIISMELCRAMMCCCLCTG